MPYFGTEVDHTHVRLAAKPEVRPTVGEYAGQLWDEFQESNPLSRALRAKELYKWKNDPDPTSKLSIEEANKLYSIPGVLQFHEPINRVAAHILNEEYMRRDKTATMAALRGGGVGDGLLNFGVGLASSFTDPILLASSLVPVMRGPGALAQRASVGRALGGGVGRMTLRAKEEAMVAAKAALQRESPDLLRAGGQAAKDALETRAKDFMSDAALSSLLRTRVAVGALEGTFGAAVVEPWNYALGKYVGDPVSIEESALNLTFGGAMGGAFPLAGAAFSKVLGRKKLDALLGPEAIRAVSESKPVEVTQVLEAAEAQQRAKELERELVRVESPRQVEPALEDVPVILEDGTLNPGVVERLNDLRDIKDEGTLRVEIRSRLLRDDVDLTGLSEERFEELVTRVKDGSDVGPAATVEPSEVTVRENRPDDAKERAAVERELRTTSTGQARSRFSRVENPSPTLLRLSRIALSGRLGKRLGSEIRALSRDGLRGLADEIGLTRVSRVLDGEPTPDVMKKAARIVADWVDRVYGPLGGKKRKLSAEEFVDVRDMSPREEAEFYSSLETRQVREGATSDIGFEAKRKALANQGEVAGDERPGLVGEDEVDLYLDEHPEALVRRSDQDALMEAYDKVTGGEWSNSATFTELVRESGVPVARVHAAVTKLLDSGFVRLEASEEPIKAQQRKDALRRGGESFDRVVMDAPRDKVSDREVGLDELLSGMAHVATAGSKVAARSLEYSRLFPTFVPTFRRLVSQLGPAIEPEVIPEPLGTFERVTTALSKVAGQKEFARSREVKVSKVGKLLSILDGYRLVPADRASVRTSDFIGDASKAGGEFVVSPLTLRKIEEALMFGEDRHFLDADLDPSTAELNIPGDRKISTDGLETETAVVEDLPRSYRTKMVQQEGEFERYTADAVDKLWDRVKHLDTRGDGYLVLKDSEGYSGKGIYIIRAPSRFGVQNTPAPKRPYLVERWDSRYETYDGQFRVHAVIRNGEPEIVRHATFDRGAVDEMPAGPDGQVDVSDMVPSVRGPLVERAEQVALEHMAKGAGLKDGQVFGLDVVISREGDFVGEVNPSEMDGGSGFLDSQYAQMAMAAHLSGTTPAFVPYLAAKQSLSEIDLTSVHSFLETSFAAAKDSAAFAAVITKRLGGWVKDFAINIWNEMVRAAGSVPRAVSLLVGNALASKAKKGGSVKIPRTFSLDDLNYAGVRVDPVDKGGFVLSDFGQTPTRPEFGTTMYQFASERDAAKALLLSAHSRHPSFYVGDELLGSAEGEVFFPGADVLAPLLYSDIVAPSSGQGLPDYVGSYRDNMSRIVEDLSSRSKAFVDALEARDQEISQLLSDSGVEAFSHHESTLKEALHQTAFASGAPMPLENWRGLLEFIDGRTEIPASEVLRHIEASGLSHHKALARWMQDRFGNTEYGNVFDWVTVHVKEPGEVAGGGAWGLFRVDGMERGLVELSLDSPQPYHTLLHELLHAVHSTMPGAGKGMIHSGGDATPRMGTFAFRDLTHKILREFDVDEKFSSGAEMFPTAVQGDMALSVGSDKAAAMSMLIFDYLDKGLAAVRDPNWLSTLRALATEAGEDIAPFLEFARSEGVEPATASGVARSAWEDVVSTAFRTQTEVQATPDALRAQLQRAQTQLADLAKIEAEQQAKFDAPKVYLQPEASRLKALETVGIDPEPPAPLAFMKLAAEEPVTALGGPAVVKPKHWLDEPSGMDTAMKKTVSCLFDL